MADAAPPAWCNERAAALRLDTLGAEVRAALARAGVASILLKGRGLQALLYDPGELRPTSDVDLLIPSDDRETAGVVLRGLGYQPDLREVWLSPEPVHAHHWRRAHERSSVDLHTRLLGTHAPARAVWASLSQHTTPMVVGGLEGPVPDAASSALICALHRAGHPLAVTRPTLDLERAVRRLDLATWETAKRLADELEATEAFSSGLRLCPAAATLADTLGVAGTVPRTRRLAAESAPIGSVLVDRLVTQRGWRGRGRIIRHGVFPNPRTMRAFHPVARRGRHGLAVAYIMRPLVVLSKSREAIRRWLATDDQPSETPRKGP